MIEKKRTRISSRRTKKRRKNIHRQVSSCWAYAAESAASICVNTCTGFGRIDIRSRALFAFALIAAGLEMIEPLFMRFIIDRVLLNTRLEAASRLLYLQVAGSCS